jgi:hypothetical protein
MHTDVDRENGGLVQIDIHGESLCIPHTWGITAAARATDACKRPANLANRTRGGMDRPLTGLDQTRALVRLQPGSPNVNSALSPFRLKANTHFEMAVRFRPSYTHERPAAGCHRKREFGGRGVQMTEHTVDTLTCSS